ncbi:MAG TPA: ATP-binding protein [Bacteroidia bacterium]|jgi:signal transduction histidine kinase|nr:ATP-binding protein [Bacteroidia bacterium]
MKTAIKDISEFLEFLKNKHFMDIIERSQTSMADEIFLSKFDPETIHSIATEALEELIRHASHKMGTYFKDTSEVIENKTNPAKEFCKILIEVEQKKLILKHISNFTSQVDEALNIVYELNAYYSEKHNDSVKSLFSNYKELETQLKEQEEELIKVTKDSQHFAYAASHDLQEPLRMITSYLQIVSSRYKDKIDAEGAEFIGFALDGSVRMKNLINGLLEFSRLNNITDVKKMNTNATLTSVLHGLEFYIKESNAEIKVDELPELIADQTLISKLFQHLISNAIKFRTDTTPPKIKISVEELDSAYKFSVSDNGIGIQKEYFDKIFVIFQRLHAKNKYPGTGIGLALCKKIVEQHGGTLWVESEPNQGATFYFTIPFKPVLTKKRSVD